MTCPHCRKDHPPGPFCPFTGTSSERDPALRDVPEEVGGYFIEKVLGDGAHGVVYAARDRKTGARAALKLLHPEGAQDPVLRQRFDREIAAACELVHPHVVRMLDIGALPDGRPWLAMELVDGESLRARLDRVKTLPLGHAIAVASAVLSALEAAHAVGIVHRDVKPENVLLEKSGGQIVPKLADFGLARRGNSGLTRPGMMLGTPRYLSPEQAKGRSDVDHRADLWGVGVMLFEMLTGSWPFDGKDIVAIAIAIVTQPVPLPSSRAAGIPPAIEAAIMRALEKDRDKRVGSARELRLVLRAAMSAPSEEDASYGLPREDVSLSDTIPPDPRR